MWLLWLASRLHRRFALPYSLASTFPTRIVGSFSRPAQLVPRLADMGIYVASEFTIHPLLEQHALNTHRGRRRPAEHHKPREPCANGPKQVWCWTITDPRAPIRVEYFYLLPGIEGSVQTRVAEHLIVDHVGAAGESHRAEGLAHAIAGSVGFATGGYGFARDQRGPSLGPLDTDLRRSRAEPSTARRLCGSGRVRRAR